MTVFLYFVCMFFLPLQAIEGFAVTVKDIAQMLQSFGTELAETELPDEGKAIEYLLVSHTEKYRKLKVRFQMFSCKMHLFQNDRNYISLLFFFFCIRSIIYFFYKVLF